MAAGDDLVVRLVVGDIVGEKHAPATVDLDMAVCGDDVIVHVIVHLVGLEQELALDVGLRRADTRRRTGQS